MGMATSRSLAAVLACTAAVATGCGASGKASSMATAKVEVAAGRGAEGLPALRAQRAPGSWGAARISTGALLSYPPGWRLSRGDRGTATAVASDPEGRIAGYLNLTPRQSRETLSDWTSFRIRHNIQEGERNVTREGARVDLRFLNGRGTCVRDSYTTVTGARYIELACLVRGSAASSVIVGAAPPRDWSTISPVLERAIAALVT